MQSELGKSFDFKLIQLVRCAICSILVSFFVPNGIDSRSLTSSRAIVNQPFTLAVFRLQELRNDDKCRRQDT